MNEQPRPVRLTKCKALCTLHEVKNPDGTYFIKEVLKVTKRIVR